MRQSEYFAKTSKTSSGDDPSVNARLLEQGGFVYKNSAGIYTYLPLGWRVLQKIMRIIRKEMNAIGGVELFMPALVEKKYLEQTGRWNVEIGYKTGGTQAGSGAEGSSFVLGWTHEEVLTEIVSHYVSSYKDLPFAAYQIQTKFRREARAKSGLLRGREFIMKDLYSFHATEENLTEYYGKVAAAYQKIFKRCGLNSIYTRAAGGDFTANYTHEFQVEATVGEDRIFVCKKCGYAENKEISQLKPGDRCPRCGGAVEEKKAIEVGNIFPLGTKYSEAFNLKYTDKSGQQQFVVMGSYGIGLGRVMGTVVEVSHDEQGIIWPRSIAPFTVHLLQLDGGAHTVSVRDHARKVYDHLIKHGIEVLYDDRPVRPGVKFADADLLGIPYRAVVSDKTLTSQPGKFIEVSRREAKAQPARYVSMLELVELLRK